MRQFFMVKCFLVLFSVLLWLIGACIFGVLLWLRLDFWSNEYLEVDNELNRYLILLYICLALSLLIVVFVIIGIVGTACVVKWALVLYLIALCLTTVLTIGAVAYGFYYRVELEESISRGKIVTHFIQQRYKGLELDRVTYVVDLMQLELKCCGGASYFDYQTSAWRETDPDKRDKMTPFSCCSDYERHQNSPDRFKKTCSIYDTTSTKEDQLNPRLNKKNCREALTEFFGKYVLAITGVVIAMFILEILTLGLTSGLIHILNNRYVPPPEDVVYDMAHNQEKSPYPSRGDYSGHGSYYR
ncbi:CD81 antigen-like [Gigantopelta aegis]|uniref:CD81 antigen-like n=1 Tax=Gigantopelta aegis TaxID=1735272 RepID=UPI001B88DEC7|nr:CD81 antigen-like [Gigantopelta aegis]